MRGLSCDEVQPITDGRFEKLFISFTLRRNESVLCLHRIHFTSAAANMIHDNSFQINYKYVSFVFQEQSHGAGDSAGGLLRSVPAGELRKKNTAN